MSTSSVCRVKICGLTTESDARDAVACGANALGFNTWSGGKRFVDLERAGPWISALSPFVTKIALLVNATIEETERIARFPFIDALQLHGDESAEYCRTAAALGRPVIKAVRARSLADLDGLEEFGTPHFLIDAHVEGLFGGTGVSANLSLATEFTKRYPGFTLVLAGGLSAGNVASAIRIVRPDAVDVSSGVESSPGRKDPAQVRAFIEAVHQSV
jgi:phosphoribosylanthranilate isomerase